MERGATRYLGEMAGDAAIETFWETHPCGDQLVGGLATAFKRDYLAFFDAYDESRYRLESHIPRCLEELDVDGKKVLEIGLGQGAESEQLVRKGARWTGLDLTAESVARVRTRMLLRGLAYDGILRASVGSIPAGDDTFDLVFSHGVLHHVPDILAAQAEIHRVLRPGGKLVVMLYARRSLNFEVSIRLVRRCCLLMAWPLRSRITSGVLGSHLRNAEREGLLNYVRMARFVHASTDGPENPFARVYDMRAIRRDFPAFCVVRSHKHFMHAPPLPVHGLPGERLMGWHLWVEMLPR